MIFIFNKARKTKVAETYTIIYSTVWLEYLQLFRK